MERLERLQALCSDFGLMAVYLFGSRSTDGRRRLHGDTVYAAGSDLDVGVFGRAGAIPPERMGALQVGLEELFAPLRVDMVPLDHVDPLFQFAAIQGERVAAPDSTAADEKELEVMRRAADLLPIQRQLELETFGVSTS
jgi:predicted nucleotidyltransferase